MNNILFRSIADIYSFCFYREIISKSSFGFGFSARSVICFCTFPWISHNVYCRLYLSVSMSVCVSRADLLFFAPIVWARANTWLKATLGLLPIFRHEHITDICLPKPISIQYLWYMHNIRRWRSTSSRRQRKLLEWNKIYLKGAKVWRAHKARACQIDRDNANYMCRIIWRVSAIKGK